MATGFSDEERAAMKQRAEELRAMKGLKGLAKLQKENEACLEAIEKLEGVDRAVAERLHERELITTNLCHAGLADADVDDVAAAFEKVFERLDALRG